MPDPTPGELAYAAYAAARVPDDATHVPTPWPHLSHTAQRAWEAAAEAVLALHETAPVPQDGLMHYVTDVARWLTQCGDASPLARRGTETWEQVTCPACHEHRDVQEDTPHA